MQTQRPRMESQSVTLRYEPLRDTEDKLEERSGISKGKRTRPRYQVSSDISLSFDEGQGQYPATDARLVAVNQVSGMITNANHACAPVLEKYAVTSYSLERQGRIDIYCNVRELIHILQSLIPNITVTW